MDDFDMAGDADADVEMEFQDSRLAIIPDDNVVAQLQDLAPSQPGPTLLPSPVARAVSFATRSTSLALRMGTLVTGYGFDAAKVTTLSSLELGRAVLEGILGRAGRDVISRSGSVSAKRDAETVLERSLENLHRTMTQIVFWTTTGFHVTGTTIAVFSETSLLLLSTLDQFFGSTDSSRAMASIITLIRREFQNPATGVQGEKVGVIDLMLGLCGMAYLQRWCRRLLEEENRNLRIEEVIWDVVVLDGARVDVHEESLYGIHNGVYTGGQSSGENPTMLDDASNEKILATIEDHGARDSDDEQDRLAEIRLKRQIMRSLPDNAKVSITTLINTTKTITVDITGGTQELPFSPPPGVELIEESRSTQQPPPRSQLQHDSIPDSIPPTCRVVYRLNRNRERRTSFQKEDGDISQVAGYVEQVDDEAGQGSDTEVEETPPPLPPKPSGTSSLLHARRPSSAASVASTSSTASSKPSRIPAPTKLDTPSPGAENTANQKRPRMPLTPSPSLANTRPKAAVSRKPSLNRFLGSKTTEKNTEKKGGLRNAFKGAMFSNKDASTSGSDTAAPAKKPKPSFQSPSARSKPASTSQPRAQPRPIVTSPPSRSSVPNRTASLIPKRSPPRAPAVRSTGVKINEEPYPRSASRTSYISVHERRRDSMVSQTDTYSITPAADEYRPISPWTVEEDVAVDRPLAKSKPDRDMSETPARTHRRGQSTMYSPSIYTLRTNESQASLIPLSYYRKSAFGDTEALGTLRRAGMVDGIFPKHHLLRNITRFMRFASASYGSNFLKLMGIAKAMPILRALDDTHHELRSFAHHTQSEADSILLSSFVDPQGGSDGTGSTNTGVPLVHYISLDRESKAVVLACRGTLGFEDVLADMTCDYDDLVWRGKTYKVHKGIHASAQRLLYGGDGRVLYTLKQALEQNPDYGLVLTGHSLGGAVTALLGVMLSEPAPGTSFMTSSDPHTKLLGDGLHSTAPPRHVCLPAGRPVHVYAYGPPSTMSASLCTATRGLITSIVNGNDMVPYLSLGVLHDFQAVALAFKTDNNEAKVEVRQRIWEAFQSGIADKWYGSSGVDAASASSSFKKGKDVPGADPSTEVGDDQWAYAALKVLRASMMSTKLLPPGEVFAIESTQVLRREAFLLEGEEGRGIGRPAQRIVLKYVRDVEKRFREVRFGTSMLTDHSPGKYEDALNKLKQGVMDS
ncbi:hypothetical protein B0H66DRAFT_90902 [Apodospora peruviana]|uniref:sn-1-specific diacylglycerol lipase n=1 Tax=Apodospora peruviana TaxID=516989 RepID=A0AAE0IU08_9PEZI|nr:hypothetical protein B0H66DRAFT_90902 [Apodospora peruviana]